jgi:hypothetical protein
MIYSLFMNIMLLLGIPQLSVDIIGEQGKKKICTLILIYNLLSLSYNVYVLVSPQYILIQLMYFHETLF